MFLVSFKKLVAAWEVELGCQSDSTAEIQSEFVPEGEVAAYYSESKLSSVINDLLDRSDCLTRSKALQKYNFIGEETYKEASQFAEKIHCFETNIRRPYFHVKPLDARQLENWHEYLNFAEKQGDFDWVVLYVLIDRSSTFVYIVFLCNFLSNFTILSIIQYRSLNCTRGA